MVKVAKLKELVLGARVLLHPEQGGGDPRAAIIVKVLSVLSCAAPRPRSRTPAETAGLAPRPLHAAAPRWLDERGDAGGPAARFLGAGPSCPACGGAGAAAHSRSALLRSAAPLPPAQHAAPLQQRPLCAHASSWQQAPRDRLELDPHEYRTSGVFFGQHFPVKFVVQQGPDPSPLHPTLSTLRPQPSTLNPQP